MRRTPDWAKISAIIDVDSFVKYYFVFELGENPEITQSSVYLQGRARQQALRRADLGLRQCLRAVRQERALRCGLPFHFHARTPRSCARRATAGWMELFRNTQFVNRELQMWDDGIAYQSNKTLSKIELPGPGHQVGGEQLRLVEGPRQADPVWSEPARGTHLQDDVRR